MQPDSTYRRPVDQTATLRERARYRLRLMKMQQAFGVLQERDASDELLPPPRRVFDVLLRCGDFGDPSGRGTPVRTRVGCPPVRDGFHQARHKRNRRARASRRLNRRG